MKLILRLVRIPTGLIGLILVIFWALIAIFAPIIAPTPENQRDPYTIKRIGFSSLPAPPSEATPFGTTSGGYDIFYGIIWGSRTAFRVGLIVVSATAVIGILLGGLGAFVGGWVDEVTMRVTDLFMAFPFLIAVIVMSIVLGKGLDKVILALVIFTWRRYARVMRSAVLPVKECEYVSAARSLGEGSLGIFLRHILPNSIFPVFVLATLDIGWTVMIAASLSFIGVGAEPGYADWGQMINFSRRWLLGAYGSPFAFWYTYIYPSLAILSFLLGFTLLGDTMRDVLDPRMRKVK